MKRSGFRPPTEEQVRRSRQRKQESAARYQEKRKARPDVGIKRGKRIRPVNQKRRGRLFEKQYHSEGFVEWVHSLGCSVPSCKSVEIEAAHAKSTGAGGTWEDILPLCTIHHRRQHDMGVRSFERHVGFRLADVAATVQLRWRAFAGDRE